MNTAKIRRIAPLLLLTAILLLLGSARPAHAEELSAGKSAPCVLTSSGGRNAEYTIRPAESGTYWFASAGATQKVYGKLYVITDQSADGDYEAGNSDDEGFCFKSDLDAGKTYILKVTSSNDQAFSVGMLQAGKRQVISNAASYVLTEASKTVKLEVIIDYEPGKFVWNNSDKAVADSDRGSGWGLGSGICASNAYYTAKKDGSARVTVSDSSGSTLAAFDLTCTDVTEYYPVYVGGVQVTSKNASSVTGSGISGSISYSHATHTLTLHDAVIRKASYTYGTDGRPLCVIGSGCNDTLNIQLTGTNRITNVDYDTTNPKNNNRYDASSFYSGISGICAEGSIRIYGSGSLLIDDGHIGTAISSDRSVTIDKGSSVSIIQTFVNQSKGVVAGDTVTVNGGLTVDGRTYTIVVDGKAGGITGYGITANNLTVGASGTVDVTESTGNQVSSYAVNLTYGGSAVINGRLNAKAEGGKGQSAGIAVLAEGTDTAVLQVAGSGKITLQGGKKAIHNVRISPGSGITLIAGSSKSNAVKTAPSSIAEQNYIESISASSDSKDEATYTVGSLVYAVKGSTATVLDAKNRKAAKITIPDTVKIKGKKLKVTGIAANAFKDMKKLTTVTIGKNIKTIGKNAFRNCKKAKSFTIRTTKLTSQSVGANAFADTHKKAVFKCPKAKKEAYRKIFLKKGMKKTAAVKGL